jgi:hypothetical protein
VIDDLTDFSVIPASNGPIYMRAGESSDGRSILSTSLTRLRIDVTDAPGYWDSVVDSPPERKRWYASRYAAIMTILMCGHRLREQEMKKPLYRRWWGAFTTWLAKVTTVR